MLYLEDSYISGPSSMPDELVGTPILSMGTGIFTRRMAMKYGVR